jgi:hypothetical protein
MHTASRRSWRALTPFLFAALPLGLAAAACGTADTDEPAVFFIQPVDGATVTSPVMVTLGARNIQIGAVPEVVETPREGVVHYHLGTNTDCMPAGIVVPQADPWIHFGDGSNEIEMYLEPGEHRLAVQAGDDEHRTVEGLCEVITITVLAEAGAEG